MIGWNRPTRRDVVPVSAEGVEKAPGATREAERAGESIWCVQWPGGRDWRETEREAEALADWLVKSKAAEFAVCFEMQVESEGDAA